MNRTFVELTAFSRKLERFYSKSESEDISPDEKKILRRQVELLKKEAGR